MEIRSEFWFFLSSRRRHTRCLSDWSSDVCSSDLILDKLAAITGLPSPKLKLPYAVAYATGVVDTLVSGTIMRREPRVTLDSVRMGRKKMFITSAKAERELGWNPGPVDGAF